MKKTIIFLLLVIAAFLTYMFFRTPFEKKYHQAITMCELAEYDKALPILQKAVDKFQDTPEYPDAAYWLAKCEVAINPKNVERWQTVINSSTNEAVIAEGRYYLAKNAEYKIKAMELFIEDYPEHHKSREFIVEIANDAKANNDMMKARKTWQLLLNNYSVSPEAAAVIDDLGKLNIEQLLSFEAQPYIDHHIVKKGEYLSTIARKEKTFVDSIRLINKLTTDRIRPGVKLKIDRSKYLIDIDISDNILTLYRIFQDSTNYVKRYSVGTGKSDNTPRGMFVINLKQKDPIWYKPGGKAIPFGSKENLLGTRWMGIDCPGFGIHGTWDTQSIGMPSSAGCVRLINEDVEQIYDIVPLGTTVKIHD